MTALEFLLAVSIALLFGIVMALVGLIGGLAMTAMKRWGIVK